MQRVAILHGQSSESAQAAESLADQAITDFTELPPEWWANAPGPSGWR